MGLPKAGLRLYMSETRGCASNSLTSKGLKATGPAIKAEVMTRWNSLPESNRIMWNQRAGK